MRLPDLSGRMPAQRALQGPSPVTLIDVSNVAPASTVLSEVPYKDAVEALLTKPPSQWAARGERTGVPPAKRVDACSQYHGQLVADVFFHPVLAAVDLAFNDHRPLVLSPDMLWLLVAQGFANHVNANAEELRPQLVRHAGMVTIAVRRDDFIRESPDNPWPEVFGEFSNRIREHVGPTTHDLLVPTFSTTTTASTAAAEVVLLDAVQSFFSYELHTYCGIPQIILEGTSEDWAMLAERTRRIGQFGLGWWTEALAPILDEFVAASLGHESRRFWQSIYKMDNKSGGPYITGWVTTFFPYLKDWRTGRASVKNPRLAQGVKELQDLLNPLDLPGPGRVEQGLKIEVFPSGLARAPFLWQYLNQSFEMEFLGGLVGVRQETDTLRLRPEIGWAVAEQAAA